MTCLALRLCFRAGGNLLIEVLSGIQKEKDDRYAQPEEGSKNDDDVEDAEACDKNGENRQGGRAGIC
jgi:hypothetical protein